MRLFRLRSKFLILDLTTRINSSFLLVDSTSLPADTMEDSIAADVHPDGAVVHDSITADVPTDGTVFTSTDHPEDTVSIQRSQHPRKPSAYLTNYDCNGIPQLHSISTSKYTSPHSLSTGFSYSQLPDSHRVFSLSVDIITEPASYLEAIQHKC